MDNLNMIIIAGTAGFVGLVLILIIIFASIKGSAKRKNKNKVEVNNLTVEQKNEDKKDENVLEVSENEQQIIEKENLNSNVYNDNTTLSNEECNEHKSDDLNNDTYETKEDIIKNSNTTTILEEKEVKEKNTPRKINTSKAEDEKPILQEIKQPVVEQEDKKGRTYEGKYEIYKESNYYRYRLKASNGEILCVSDMYVSRENALRSIDAIKRNLEKGYTKVFVDKKKNYKFKLVAANHRVLSISANYSTEKGAYSALESFKRFCLTDNIVEVELPIEKIESALVKLDIKKEEDKRGGKYILDCDDNEEYFWELRANNGEILSQAYGYSSKASLENAIESFKENVENGTFYLYKDKTDNYQFRLYSQAGRFALVGESYKTAQRVESAVLSVKNFYKLSVITDKTKEENNNNIK